MILPFVITLKGGELFQAIASFGIGIFFVTASLFILADAWKLESAQMVAKALEKESAR